MKHFIDGQEVVTEAEIAELALGTPPELWLGVAGESAEEREARIDAARGIFADEPQLVTRVLPLLLAAAGARQHKATLAKVIPLAPRRRAPRKAVA